MTPGRNIRGNGFIEMFTFTDRPLLSLFQSPLSAPVFVIATVLCEEENKKETNQTSGVYTVLMEIFNVELLFRTH